MNYLIYITIVLFSIVYIVITFKYKSNLLNNVLQDNISYITELQHLTYEYNNLELQKDQAYKERNILVALLAQVFPSGIKKTAIEGWNPEWHNCVYIELPDGSQCSWHYHDNDSYLFENLPPYEKEWDGHTTENKYFNIEELILSGSIKKITTVIDNSKLKDL